MAPRLVLAALSIAFGIAVIGATVTTVRQLNLQTWHSTDARSRAAATQTNEPSYQNETSRSQIDAHG